MMTKIFRQRVFQNFLETLSSLAVVIMLASLGAGCTKTQDNKPVIESAWIRMPAQGRDMTAAYLVVENKNGADDRLFSITSPLADRLEMHETIRDDNIMRMRLVEFIDIPAGGKAVMAPGGKHIMVFGLKKALVEGETVPLVLRFEKAGEVKTEAKIRQKMP